jgi:ABC-type nitrate/sulfonate/bicarbonate transport system substrate-binding protein
MTGQIDRRLVLGGGCSLAATLAGCGKPAAPVEGAVEIVMTQGVSGLIVHQVALDQGFFKQFGIKPNVLLVSDGTKSVAALLSGSAQLCAWSGFNQLTPAIEKGAQIKILAGALNLPSLVMYSGFPEIKSVADLKGKVIGIGSPGSVLHQMTTLLLTKKGIDPKAVTFRNVGSNADIFKAVVGKTVDAGLSDVDVFDRQAEFGVHALPDGMLWKEIPEFTNQGTYASDTAIKNDRDKLVGVLAAYAKAYRFVSAPESKQAFIDARRKVTGETDSKQALTQWNWIQANQPYAKNLVLSDDQINLVQKLNVDFGIQKAILPIGRVADMSLAQDALKLIN